MGNFLELIEEHAQMCADYERMGTGEFRQKYPDYDMRQAEGRGPEGVGYITRKAAQLAKRARAALTTGETSPERGTSNG